MSYEKYPEYKDSGIKWIGDVPFDWEKSRLKYCVSINMGQAPKSEDCNQDGDGIPFLQGNAEFGIDHPEAKNFSLAANKFAEKDDILFSVRAPIGAINIADQKYGIGRGLCAFTPTKIKSRYFIYALEYIKAELFSIATGSTYSAVSISQIANSQLVIPPPAEQQLIVAFLNKETKRIDDLIAEQQKLIDLIAQKRQALIFHAVTKGLNPDVPMKPSGINWLGDIPRHWDVERLATLFAEEIESGDENLPILQVSIHSGVSDDEIPDEERDRKVARSEDKSKYKRVKPDDLVFNMMRAWQGAFGTVKVEGLVSPAYIVARPKKSFSTDYVEALLRTPTAVDEIKRFSRGITDFRLRLYWAEFKNIRIPLPPIDEQDKIISRLAEEDKKLNSLRTEAEQGIELLQERRSALISAAVTGKICVVEHAEGQKSEQKREANAFFKRSVFAAEIIERMHHEPTFGHVKFQKMLFLAENICNIDLATHYHRDAAGPYDNRMLRSVDSQLSKQKWFRCEKRDKGYRYIPLENEGKYRQYFERYFSDQEEQLSALCKRFMTATTEQCEIVATLYSAWKDLLAVGHPSDARIVDEVLNHWHPSKQRIPRDKWLIALDWMRVHHLTPEETI